METVAVEQSNEKASFFASTNGTTRRVATVNTSAKSNVMMGQAGLVSQTTKVCSSASEHDTRQPNSASMVKYPTKAGAARRRVSAFLPEVLRGAAGRPGQLVAA